MKIDWKRVKSFFWPVYNQRSIILLLGLIFSSLYASFYLLSDLFVGWGEEHLPSQDGVVNLILLFSFLVLLVFYYLASHYFVNLKNIKIVVIFSVIFCLILWLVRPLLSADLFLYILYPKIWLYYGANPYLAPVGNFLNDSLFFSGQVFTGWLNQVLVYGPVWLLIASAVAWLNWSNFLAAVLIQKFIAVIFFLGSGGLIYLILQKVNGVKKNLGAALFLWSPIFLLEAVNNGHNDILMIGFLLLALYFLVQEKYFWVLPALLASILIKFLTLIFLPFLLYYLWRKIEPTRRRELFWSIIFCLVLLALFYLSFLADSHFFQSFNLFFSPTSFFYNFKGLPALGFLVIALGSWIDKTSDVYSWITLAHPLGQLVFLFFYCRLLWRRDFLDFDKLIKTFLVILLLFYLTANFYLQSWYFLLPISLLILVRDWPTRWVVLLTVLGMLNYFYLWFFLSVVLIFFLVMDRPLHNIKVKKYVANN